MEKIDFGKISCLSEDEFLKNIDNAESEFKDIFKIGYEYETCRTDKEYWVDKFEKIKNSFEWKCPTQQTLAKFQYELHKWQMYVNMAFHITNTEAITVSFDFDTNTLHINMNKELQKLFN